MQTTSALWKELFRTRGTVREYAFDINGVWYGPDAEVEHSASGDTFSDFSFGNAPSARLSLSLYADNVPKGAKIKRFVRLKNGETVSEWIPKGVFFTNTRAVDDGFWSLTAFDAMKKAEKPFIQETDTGNWPRPMNTVVQEIAQRMGVTIDSRTVINSAYTLQYPGELTMRNILRHVAAAHAANFIITDVGELLMLPLLSAPTETNYLVTEYGDAITFGGVKIRV